MILVTGANGNVGGEVMRRLIAKGHAVRALVRSRDKTRDFPDTVEIVVGDFADDATLRRAVAGAEAVYMTSFEHPDLLRLQMNLIAAAREGGSRVLVRISGMRAAPGASAEISRVHGLGDRQLADSGLGYVLLQPNWFHQNFFWLFRNGLMRLPVGEGRTSFVDVRDIAAVAVAALTDPSHRGKTYVLTGPEALTHEEIAQVISQATGKSFAFEDVGDETWRAQALKGGMNQRSVDGLLGLFRMIRDGSMAEVSRDVERVVGRPPIAFRQFARDYAEELS